MRTFLLAIAMLLSVASPVSAKLGVQLGVKVQGDQDGQFDKSLKEAMEARLNSTERYSITTPSPTADLLLMVSCLAVHNTAGHKTGFVCDSVVVYFPYRGNVLLAAPVEGAGYLSVGGLRIPGHGDQ
jgi:hypothetical protein